MEPAEVGHVVLTHLHADHAGGTVGAGGAPRFPNAVYHVHPADWEHFTAEPDPDLYDARLAMEPILVAGMLDLHEDDHEVSPGVHVMHSPGHTPGHRSVLLRDEEATLLLTGDLLHLPIQVEHPDLPSSHDEDPELGCAVAARPARPGPVEGRGTSRCRTSPARSGTWRRPAGRSGDGVASRPRRAGPAAGPGPSRASDRSHRGKEPWHAATCPDHGRRRARLPQLQRRLPRRPVDPRSSRSPRRRSRSSTTAGTRRRLAGERYPDGIQIHDESELVPLIRDLDVDDVVFSYSDVSHEYVMHMASTVLAAGANFELLGPDATMLQATVPTVAVCAVRTGVGKSQTTRAIAGALKDAGKRVVAVRHPMPYGDLAAQRVQRYADARRPRPLRLHDRGARGVRAAHRLRHRDLRGRRLRRDPRAGAGGVRRAAVGRREQRSAVLPPGRVRSRSSTRCGPATSWPTTPARPTCAWPTSS